MAATEKTWVNDDPPQLDDVDLNGFKNENNELIESASIALNTSDNTQTTKAVSVYAAGGDFYIDSGSVNSCVLTPQGSKLPPPSYFPGMRIAFFPAHDNTSAVVVNAANLGVKNLVDQSGNPLSVGKLKTGEYAHAVYNGTNFRLIEGANANGVFITTEQLRNLTFISIVDTGSVNTVVANPNAVYTEYTGFTQIWVFIEHTNTGASTLNISGLGAIEIVKKNPFGEQLTLTGGELVEATWAHFIYDGTYFELQNQANFLEIQSSQHLEFISIVDTGSVNAVVANPPIPYKAYIGFTQVWVFIEHTNTGASTLNISGLGAVSITKKSERGGTPIPLNGGEMLQSTWAHFVYNGTSFELINPAPVVDGTLSYAVDSSGVSNAILANPVIPYSSYKPGTHIRVKVANTNSGASTLDISGIGSVNIQKMTTGGLINVVLDNLRAGGIYDFVYNGTVFEVLNPT